MSRAAVAVLVLAAACKGGDRKTIARTDGGAPPVQVVDRGGAVSPPGAPEVEPNDAADTAMALPVAGARGALDGAADVDVYAITSEGARLLDARLTAMAGVDGKLELRDEAFAVIATADRGGVGAAERFPNLSLDRGRYFLVVRADEHRKPKITGGNSYSEGSIEGDVVVFDLGSDPPKALGSFPISTELTETVKVREGASRESVQYALDEALRKTALGAIEKALAR